MRVPVSRATQREPTLAGYPASVESATCLRSRSAIASWRAHTPSLPPPSAGHSPGACLRRCHRRTDRPTPQPMLALLDLSRAARTSVRLAVPCRSNHRFLDCFCWPFHCSSVWVAACDCRDNHFFCSAFGATPHPVPHALSDITLMQPERARRAAARMRRVTCSAAKKCAIRLAVN